MAHAGPNAGSAVERPLGQIPRFVRLNIPAGHLEIPWQHWTGPTGLRALAALGQSAFDSWFFSGPMANFRPYPDSPSYAEWYLVRTPAERAQLRIDAWLIAPAMPPWAAAGA
jgi:hypothetical protein